MFVIYNCATQPALYDNEGHAGQEVIQLWGMPYVRPNRAQMTALWFVVFPAST